MLDISRIFFTIKNASVHSGRIFKFLFRVLFLLLLFRSPVFGDFGATAGLDYNDTKDSIDGQEATTDKFSQNYFLKYNSKFSPVLSYGLYLRSNFIDSTMTSPEGLRSESSSKDVEPMFDLTFRNPIYNFIGGYKYRKSWTETDESDSDSTNEYIYSRFAITPIDLPRIYFQFDRHNIKPDEKITTAYTASSSYDLTYKNFSVGYNARYLHSDNEMKATENTLDTFSGQFNMAYYRYFWNNRLRITSGYRGNYNESKYERFFSSAGSVTDTVLRFQGLYDTSKGTFVQPNVDTLDTNEPLLIDSDLNTGISQVNIGTDQFLNIGLNVSSTEEVRGLYIYVNKDVTTDTVLSDPANWLVYRNSVNANWQSSFAESVSIQSSLPVEVDHNIYRYEIVFSAPQKAAWYKVINLETVNLPLSPGMDVMVTELEAYKITEVSAGGSLKRETVSFIQGLDLNANLRAAQGLELVFNYSIGRNDIQPESVLDSAKGIFQNIFSKTFPGGDDEFRSIVTRQYGAVANWLTHRLLTTRFSIQRSEGFDNLDKVDYANNGYGLNFNYIPLPTLDVNLSFDRSDNFSFGQKSSTVESATFSAGAKLYKDVNFTMDTGYSRSKFFETDKKQSTLYFNGDLQARLTPKLSWNMAYRLNSSKSGSDKSVLHDSLVSVTYRPGRLFGITAYLRYIIGDDEERTLTNSVQLDWRPLDVLSLSLNYQKTSKRPEDDESDNFVSSLRWQIFRFMDFQIYYYTNRVVKDSETKNSTVGLKLNCSFW